MFVFVFFFVSVSVIHVFVHLNLLASSILMCVCGWEVDWSDRQRQVANWNQSTISVVINNLYSQTLHYQTLTTYIMAPYQYSLDVFGDFNISRVSPQIVYRCSDNFWQCWSLYSPNLTILLSEFNSMVLASGGLVWSAAGSTCKVKISQPSTTSTQAGKSNRIKII